ncbi:MAG: hypothetical protein KDK24_00425 [Pseudooceanicola sp.]|nr:hypothetical protein [Pseudooceanicola sp.]
MPEGARGSGVFLKRAVAFVALAGLGALLYFGGARVTGLIAKPSPYCLAQAQLAAAIMLRRQAGDSREAVLAGGPARSEGKNPKLDSLSRAAMAPLVEAAWALPIAPPGGGAAAARAFSQQVLDDCVRDGH